MTYYVEITKPDGERVAGELESVKEMTPMELITEVMEFAQTEGICPSWAVSNSKYTIREKH